MTVKNAKSHPEVFYGLHFCPGVARYVEQDGSSYCIYIGEDAAKKMDTTFSGKPVYLGHVDKVNLENIQLEADGYVFNSFYNAADGKHWAKFVIVSDQAKDAIKRGFRLSNAYVPKGAFGPAGMWHGVDYEKEVLDGEYEHLAIVDDPRYDESVILTQEEFKLYNERKELELKQFANSKDKGDPQMKFNLFKRTKVENTKDSAVDFENLMIELPTSKKEISLSKLVEEHDKVVNMHGYANGDHLVKVGEDEMSVNDLVKKHMEMCNKMTAMENEGSDVEDESMENEELGGEGLGEESDEKLYSNVDDDQAEDDEAPKAKKNSKVIPAKKTPKGENFKAMKNAQKNALQVEEMVVDLPMDKVARGKARYGSN